MRIFYGILILAALLPVMTGCRCNAPCGTPVESRDFRTVQAYLDQDAAEYFIISGANIKKILNRNLEILEQFTWDNKQLSHEEKIAFQRRLAILKLGLKLAGAEDLQSCGFSSKTLAGNPFGDDFIHSKIVLTFPENSPGLLNTLFARKNLIDIPETFGDLPAETRFAAAAAVTPEAILQILKSSGMWGENKALELPGELPWEQTFKELSGVWQIVLLNDREDSLMITVPDHDGIIRELVNTSKKPLLPNIKIIPGEKNVKLYFSPAAEKIFTAPKFKKMRDRADFKTLLKSIPPRGIAYVFRKNSFSLPDALELPGEDYETKLPSLFVAARSDNGIFAAVNCEQSVLDAVISALNRAFVLPKIKQLHRPGTASTPPGSQMKNKTVSVSKPETCPVCKDLLAAVKNSPNRTGISGDAGTCRAVSFGIAPDPELPQAIAISKKHPDSFYVLFNDNTVSRYELSNATSCRRIISFLHTIKRYRENLLMQLMQKAAEFDQNLNK